MEGVFRQGLLLFLDLGEPVSWATGPSQLIQGSTGSCPSGNSLTQRSLEFIVLDPASVI
jgi:hypothetical protein